MGKKQQAIKSLLDNLIKKMMAYACYNNVNVARARERVSELQQYGVLGVDRFVRKLLDVVHDKQSYLDILVEGRFAILLARNKFLNIEIEYVQKGPDLKAVWNRTTVYFEVTRKRSKVDEWAEQPEDVELPSEDVTGKIQAKLGQLEGGKVNVLVFWSNTVVVDESQMREAFECMQQEIDYDASVYRRLSGILFFNGGGFSFPTMKQCYLFRNERAMKPIGPRLAKKLDSLNERSSKQLKKERKSWTVFTKGNYQ